MNTLKHIINFLAVLVALAISFAIFVGGVIAGWCLKEYELEEKESEDTNV